MGCTFCATGTMGLVANLTAGEIVEQIFHASRRYPVRNVVFMGMGEPLDNYDCVLSALETMQDKFCFGISPSKITVSTVRARSRLFSLPLVASLPPRTGTHAQVGVVPRVRRLALDCPQVILRVFVVTMFTASFTVATVEEFAHNLLIPRSTWPYHSTLRRKPAVCASFLQPLVPSPSLCSWACFWTFLEHMCLISLCTEQIHPPTHPPSHSSVPSRDADGCFGLLPEYYWQDGHD
jgi:hypothetical protein